MKKRSDSLEHLLGCYLQIRAAAQSLQAHLARALSDIEGKDAAARAVVLTRALEEGLTLRRQCEDEVSEGLTAIAKLFAKDAAMHAWCPDYAVGIKNEWGLLPIRWPSNEGKPDEIADAFRKLVQSLDYIIFECARTSPSGRPSSSKPPWATTSRAAPSYEPSC
jgi:hypothetical protein